MRVFLGPGGPSPPTSVSHTLMRSALISASPPTRIACSTAPAQQGTHQSAVLCMLACNHNHNYTHTHSRQLYHRHPNVLNGVQSAHMLVQVHACQSDGVGNRVMLVIAVLHARAYCPLYSVCTARVDCCVTWWCCSDQVIAREGLL